MSNTTEYKTEIQESDPQDMKLQLVESESWREIQMKELKSEPTEPKSKKSSKRNIKCKICKKTFNSRYTIREHSKIHSTDRPYKCDICGKGFKQSCSLLNHNSIHSGLKPFSCLHCDASFRMKTTLKKHMESHSRPFRYSCKVCNEGFHQLMELNHHKKETGHKKEEIPCLFCEKKFTVQVNLENHMQIHTTESVHKCPHCSASSTTKRGLDHHIIAKHSKISDFMCSECDYAANSARCLKDHMRSHTKETPFQCALCDKKFTMLQTLKNHMQIHLHVEKKHKCKYCNFKSFRAASLKLHIRTHTNERPYSCTVCGYSTGDSSTLKKHLQNHSATKDYECNICGNKYQHYRSMQLHRKKSHTELVTKLDQVVKKDRGAD